MSRIGKKPVALPSGVTIEVKNGVVHVSGPKGELTYMHLPCVQVVVDEGVMRVELKEQTRQGRAFHGLTRALIANMVHGVHEGYEKKLELIGVGYKVQVQGKKLTLHLGFSNPVEFPLPDGIEALQDEKNKNILILRGIDKQLIGEVAAAIRGLRPPEPYKGKGIRYLGEQVRRKVGKAAAAKSA